jgi:hypothetical protein
MPFSISGLLSSLWPISVSRDDNSLDMEKGTSGVLRMGKIDVFTYKYVIMYLIILYANFLHYPFISFNVKHRKCHNDICHRGKTLITRYQASVNPNDVTSAQLLIAVQRGKICWRFGGRTLNRYRSLISINLVSVIFMHVIIID